jgi:hypothetical protein
MPAPCRLFTHERHKHWTTNMTFCARSVIFALRKLLNTNRRFTIGGFIRFISKGCLMPGHSTGFGIIHPFDLALKCAAGASCRY